MIVSKVPFRVSILGGGTDFKDYYKHKYGQVVSTTIDKYMHICIIPRFEKETHIRYSKTEIVDTIDKIQHSIIREVLKMYNVKSLEIVVMSDIPAHGSGLGSSSALTAGLIQALGYFKKKIYTKSELANLTCECEINRLNSPIGYQDQYAVVYGGLSHIIFRENHISVKSLPKGDYQRISLLKDSIMLFYLGQGKESREILTEHKNNIPLKEKILDEQVYLVNQFIEWHKGRYKDIYIGELVNRNWDLKVQMSEKSTNDYIEKCREKALTAGAWGAKVCGSGGGGFMMVICPLEKQDTVRAKIGLKELNFNFETKGAQLKNV